MPREDPQLETADVGSYYNPYQEYDLRGVNLEFTRILQQYANPYLYGSTAAPPANYVELPKPREDPQLEEVEVTGTRPSLADRQFPVVVDNFETHAMNDEELATYYGGGDAAYEQMWRERHPNEPDLPRGDYDDEEDSDDSFLVPPMLLYPAVGTLSTLVGAILAGIGAIFLPQPTGPRGFDEAPTQPGTPRIPPKIPLPPFFDPIMPPNWEDIANEPYNDFIDIPDILLPAPRVDPGDFQRFILPIGDDPGLLFSDPYMPEFPFPELQPRPTPSPRPSRPAPFPLSDPLPGIFADPVGNPFDQPYFQPFPDPGDKPFPTLPPKIDLPPKIADPFLPPGGDVVPFDPTTFLPPGLDPDFFNPTSPGPGTFNEYKPERAGCDCTDTKTKKDKKQKKKSKPREICYEGHYIEHSRGLTKKRGKEIPCSQAAKGSAGRSTPQRKPVRRPPVPSLPDLAKDIFGYP